MEAVINVIERLVNDQQYWIETLVYVMTEENREKVPFILRPAQLAVLRLEYEARKRGINQLLIPKARRHGITTVAQAASLHKCCTVPNTKCRTLAHREQDAKDIFNDLALFMYENLPEKFKPKRLGHGKTTIQLENLNSFFDFGTAGATSGGRGSTYSRTHVSEAAYVDDLSSLRKNLQTATRMGTYIEESTGNGCSGGFYESCMETLERGEMIEPAMYMGNNKYAMLFLPWYLDARNTLPFAYDLTPEKPNCDQIDEQVRGEADLIAMVMDRYGTTITKEQLHWRRDAKASGESRAGFQQEFPETINECFMATSDSRFDSREIMDGAKACLNPISSKRVYNGRMRVWEEPVGSQMYVMGVDIADGVNGGDNSYITIHKRGNFRQVAAFHGKCSPKELAKMASELGEKYNYCLINPERNNHGAAFILALDEIYHYENIFYFKDDKMGFNNNKKTRTPAVDDIAEYINNGYAKGFILDMVLWGELPTFARQTSGKYEARSPHHDDAIMGIIMAYIANLCPIVREHWGSLIF